MEDGTMIKVFGVLNHIGNQAEMLKLADNYDVEFTYLENNVRRWSDASSRPMHPKLKWATHYEPGKYDVAILHVDQQHTDPNIGKGWLYTDLNDIIQDIPKIVINHGTPMWDEFYTEDMVINGGEMVTERGTKRLVGMKEKIGDNFMVVNSYESVDRWGWGYPLIHGLDPDEWWDLPKEPRVSVLVSPGGLSKYYNRPLISAIKTAVYEKSGIDILHPNVNVDLSGDNWKEYRQLVGTSLITIFPFLDSPMPRSRTEAMLSGCCVLTSRHHGADGFIEHGVNGFILPDNPDSYAEAIHTLINDCYKDAVAMGQKGKETAKKIFSPEAYQKDLYHIIKEVSEGRKPVWNGEKRW
jgi:glycosyltransferase involved in cell wall biosynthesis